MHSHQEPHSLFPEYWIPHSTLIRLDDEGAEWECPFCGCPHKAIEVDDETVSFVALESRQCWKSFEEECPDCGETYKCVSGCTGREDLSSLLEEFFEEPEEEEGLVLWLEAAPNEPVRVPGGLPMWGGPFEA